MDEVGRGGGPQPWETGPGGLNGSATPGGRRRSGEPAGDTGVSASGRRRLREPLDEPRRGTGAEPWGAEPGPGWPDGPERADGVRPGRTEQPRGGGRRYVREPSGAPGFGDGPAPRDTDLDGSGGRRRRREPDRTSPARDGSPTEPWAFEPGGPAGREPGGQVGNGAPRVDRPGRRTLGTEYLVDTGEQDAGWDEALDGYAEPRRGGRHSGGEAGVVSPQTVRLQTLLSDLDPNRPTGRHRRRSG